MINNNIYALLIGVGDYKKIKITDLPSYRMDVALIGTGLTSGLKCMQEHIRFMAGEDNDGVVSISSLAKGVDSFKRALSTEDTFIFYFSGHGSSENLVFSDGQVDQQSVINYIDQLPCKNKIVILDCCYSGRFETSGANHLSIEQSLDMFAGHGIAVYASSSDDEVSRLGPNGNHSMFTGALSSAIISPSIVHKGQIAFLKINMYKDLCNNEDNVKSNPIIRAFAGEDSELDEIPEELYNYDHDSIPSIDTYQVVNADSSQQDAILLSQKGVSFVMQGPPGTGKSQTITNIIAQGLADGKRILFVSEKAAALEVVYKRLSEVHLDDFCLALHNYKANKKEVLDELAKSLELSPIKVKAEETAKLTELDTLKEFLGQYVSDIHEEKMPLEMSLYEVYGALVALEDTIELPLEIKSAENMTKDQVNRLGLLVVDFDKAKNNLGEQWYKNPWNGTNIVNSLKCTEAHEDREE